MKNQVVIPVVLFLLLPASVSLAGPAEPLSALTRMPVREITVFKDGHAFVLHSGAMPTNAEGNVVMDYLPTPVLGTFWPYSSDRKVKLTAVRASQRRVLIDRTALNLRELLEGNLGVESLITETSGTKYAATLVGIPERTAEELTLTSAPNSGEKLSEKGSVILLKTDEGVKVVPLDRIQDVTFKKPHVTSVAKEEFRNLLTLKLDWGKRKLEKTAAVGMVYLQKGVRWIPNYKVTIDGEGNAEVKLQATLLNELTDFEDVTTHLVIGVPTFAFKDTPDPMSLQQTVAQLSQYFRQDAQTAYAMSNAIMSQSARMSESNASVPARPTVDLGPEVTDSKKTEDMFLFTVEHVTLKKGERMALPVTEYTLKYKDVFTLELPFAPPSEVYRNFDNNRQAELARLFAAPKVTHKIRLANKSEYPLTTAPALIVRGDRPLAQGMMTYTAIGADTDLEVTTAVDVPVKKTDAETKRTPNAVAWNGNSYTRVDLAGTVSLTNHRNETVDLEIVRHVLGNIDSADHDGVVEKVNILEEGRSLAPADYPYWWNWYDWPYWWRRFNGVGRVTWKLTLGAGETADLGYTWHYFWQ